MAIDVIRTAGDPQVGNLATPINSSGIITGFLQNLPIYRPGLTMFRRGLEVGMAHGYFLYGPFAKLGPLRDTSSANLAGVLATCGFVIFLKIGLTLYAKSNPAAPLDNLFGSAPAELKNAKGWTDFSRSFLIGGLGGAVFAGALTLLGQTFGFLS